MWQRFFCRVLIRRLGLRRMGTVDDEHGLQIDLLLRSNRCDRPGEFGRAGPLGEYDNCNVVLGFRACTIPGLRRHLCGGAGEQETSGVEDDDVA